jgi:hypothetical protein
MAPAQETRRHVASLRARSGNPDYRYVSFSGNVSLFKVEIFRATIGAAGLAGLAGYLK